MKPRKRRYVLKVRGEQVAETRGRITEAIMQLHEELGPRHTTVSAIAERAGVERLTVYRHFRDASEMFAACSRRHVELNPVPGPETWAGETDPRRRTQRGLEAMYDYFSRTARLYSKVYADVDEIPELKTLMEDFDAHLRALADDLASAWPADAGASRRQVVLRHALRFQTWQSLEALHVGNAEKAALILAWLSAQALSVPPPARDEEKRPTRRRVEAA